MNRTFLKISSLHEEQGQLERYKSEVIGAFSVVDPIQQNILPDQDAHMPSLLSLVYNLISPSE